MKTEAQTLHYTVHVNAQSATPQTGPLFLPSPPPATQEDTIVQFNMDMPKRLRTAIRRKALNMDMPAATAVREVLEAWIKQG